MCSWLLCVSVVIVYNHCCHTCVVQEVTTLRKRTYQLESLESTDYADDFADRLQAAIDEAREELERETELHRLDMERSYKDKVRESDVRMMIVIYCCSL